MLGQRSCKIFSLKLGFQSLVAAGGALAAVVAVVAFIFLGPPLIRVENKSAHELRDVVVTAKGFTKHFERLGVGESICVRATGIRGESGLALRFTAGGAQKEAKDLTYVEGGGGYRVRVDVNQDLTARASYASSWRPLCGLFR